MSARRAPATFRLTHPEPGPHVCKACGKVLKDPSRHAGTAACATAARRALIERLGLIEVWWRESKLLTAAGIVVTLIRDQRGKRRWYAAPPTVGALRALSAANVPDKRIVELLRGPPEELERELAVIALGGRTRLWPEPGDIAMLNNLASRTP